MHKLDMHLIRYLLVSIKKIYMLMLFRKATVVYSENRSKPVEAVQAKPRVVLKQKTHVIACTKFLFVSANNLHTLVQNEPFHFRITGLKNATQSPTT
jgi:hypothetical protein